MLTFTIVDGLASHTRFVWVLWLRGVSVHMCALHDLVPPTVWNAFLNKGWRLKQSIQLVHVPQLAKCRTQNTTWQSVLL